MQMTMRWYGSQYDTVTLQQIRQTVNISDAIKTGAPERDKDIDAYIKTLENLGKADIHMVCYNFMPVFDWTRTELARMRKDGSTVLAYNQKTVDSIDPAKMFDSMRRNCLQT